MDDIIDLELEKIERIIDKIDADPESEDVRHTERALWDKIYKKSGQGRRTGVGITAEGDMLAALGLRYGTEEATEFSEKSTQDSSSRCLSFFSGNGQKNAVPSKYTIANVNRTIRSSNAWQKPPTRSYMKK